MKKSSGRARATKKTRSLPAKAMSGKSAAGVKGGATKASAKEFLQFKFNTVFTTK
jgi:hypothetical protein